MGSVVRAVVLGLLIALVLVPLGLIAVVIGVPLVLLALVIGAPLLLVGGVVACALLFALAVVLAVVTTKVLVFVIFPIWLVVEIVRAVTGGCSRRRHAYY
jgi:hypothetical protein